MTSQAAKPPVLQAEASPIPHLRKQGTATQLIVAGKPLLMLGGELHNSSSSSLEYMEPIWPKLARMNLNTVLVALSWELVEPEEGQFDFRLVDGLIEGARRHNLRLVFLWFGSWKNSRSSYVPGWVKQDQDRFPLVRIGDGRKLEILSTLSDAARDADARAYAALMRHIKEVDGRQHTVVMMQVENEVGILGDSRDRSEAANEAFAGPVPQELIDYIVENKATLNPRFRAVWEANGSKTSGTWEEVFGPGRPAGELLPDRVTSPPLGRREYEYEWLDLRWPADEFFMAWHYGRYMNAVAEAGRAEYDLPTFVNAWLQQRGMPWPGTYPSGGPLPQVQDIWRAAAPAVDFIAPDIYAEEFALVSKIFNRSGNPLFIPETRGGEVGAANVFYAIGQHDAMGFCPFGIDSSWTARRAGVPVEDVERMPMARAYRTLSQLAPTILEKQGRGEMAGLLIEDGAGTATAELGGYRFEATLATQSFVPGSSSDAGGPSGAGAIVISIGPGEFLIAGSGGLNITFSSATPGPAKVGILRADEVRYENGAWIAGRRLNGDFTRQGERVMIDTFLYSERYPVTRVKLYQFD